MNKLPAIYREMILPHLPERAFLRRDRDGALFITNAPQFADASSLTALLQARGFLCARNGSFLTLSPGPALLSAFELRHDPPDHFCKTLLRFRGQSPSDDALRLFARGVQLLEHADPAGTDGYFRRTRQLAALSLRNHQGGAYACALICHTLSQRKEPQQ